NDKPKPQPGHLDAAETPADAGAPADAPVVIVAQDASVTQTDGAPAPDVAEPDAAVDGRPALPLNAVPAPWVSEDIGPVGMKGGAGRTGQGAGAPGRFHVQ